MSLINTSRSNIHNIERKIKDKSSSMMGELDLYDAQLAMSPVKGNPFEAENFYPADAFFSEAAGCPRGYSMNYWKECMKNKRKGPSAFDAEINSEATGFFQGIREGSRKRQKARQERRKTRVESKAEARKQQAEAQRLAAASLGKESQADVELAKALGAQQTQTGMSTTTKVLIGVGVAAVLGIATILLIKRGKQS